MSAQAEELARQLLETTQSGKLKWQLIPDPEAESYASDTPEGISFSISRKARGDDKEITFVFRESGRIVLSDTENNYVDPSSAALLREQAMSFLSSRSSVSMTSPPNETRMKRFRLFTDLFYAAQATSERKEDEAVQKAQQFLSSLA